LATIAIELRYLHSSLLPLNTIPLLATTHHMLEHVGILNFPYKFCVHLFFVGVGLVLSYKKTHLEDINVSILTLIHICPCVHVCNVNDDQFQVGM
jgi:hypothetical protein